jgi:hypothetical protein
MPCADLRRRVDAERAREPANARLGAPPRRGHLPAGGLTFALFFLLR